MDNQHMNLIIEQRADPWVFRHADGFYYFTASVPEYDRIEIRKSETIKGLETSEPKVVWTKYDTGPMSKHIWAPEIHFIEGKWFIYFAAGERESIWKIRPYALECSDVDPIEGDWKECGMLRKAEGDLFSFTEFSLDATTFEHKNKRYLVWAQKVNGEKGISNLYIAEMKDPVTLSTVQVMLSTPDYDWERQGFWVNEGPAVIKRNRKVYITYSASATDHHYCIGLLTASQEDDLLDPDSWRKNREPIFQSSEESQLFGPGHNCFTTSEDGSKDIMIYHARDYKEIQGDPLYDPNRHARAAEVTWSTEGITIHL